MDLARSAALLGMVIYHFTYDLELFGYLAPHTAVTGGWAVFARVIAGSFLFLAGVSLYLAHGQDIRWQAFLRRLLVIGAAAGLITIGTYFAMPDRFVYFGILHSIAACSVIGLAFLRLPVAVTLVAAALALSAPALFRADVFNQPALYWLGLSTAARRAVDFVPVLPWLAPCLLGIGLTKLAVRAGLLDQAGAVPPGPAIRALAWLGRHSLPIYLMHQPLLIAVIWAFTKLKG